MTYDLVVLFEHPEWQKPLFAALERRGVLFTRYDLKHGAFNPAEAPEARLYFNQASPSAYVRGNTRAVPLALALMRSLEYGGARVLNGTGAFSLELSKTRQIAMMHQLSVHHPVTMAFNDVEVAIEQWGNRWPALLKPEQGGSGARMYLLHSSAELRRLLLDRSDLWLPENLLLLQEYFPVDPAKGIVRMEFVGKELLYAMRVISHGSFNLCPSEVCNPQTGESSCALPEVKPASPVEFFPYPEVPVEAIEVGKKLMAAGSLAIGGIEFLEAADGRLIFYDINANSNLRPAIAQSFGFDPFERVVDYLVTQLAQ